MAQPVLIPRPKQLPDFQANRVREYNILEKLADGECSRIFKASHETTNATVVIKVIEKNHIQSVEGRETYQNYVDSVKSIDNPNVIKVIDFFWDNDFYFIVLPYYEYSDMRKVILDSGALPESVARHFFQQIARGLKAGHDKGIAHKDLCLARILMSDSENIVVSGFQLSRSQRHSPFYSAPEVVCGIHHDPIRADIWSLGVLLYILVTGQNPFEDKNLMTMKNRILMGSFSLPKGVSNSCRDLISRLIVIKPQARLTIDQVLRHPWILADEGEDTGVLDTVKEVTSSITERRTSQACLRTPNIAINKAASLCRPNFVNGKKLRPVSHAPKPVVLMLQKVNRI